ncbi:transient receptor potential cation channel subfamily M member-like 2 [Saccostrea echinata]|uniref:transient receptor potential cation channel subfamily M member-like 2 n=1 Tax=Saccostrea echinata TaxID=191078 RepID=UPI002A81357E|nr:transient receptor potential cation channel subfamily M member-like 2 [Saccostrea echinata]
MSDDEFLRRNISISSDRELDNLHLIPSLESSHTSRYMDFQNQKPGLSDPPHRGFHRSQDDSMGSTRRTWTEESELRNHGGSEEELTPVKKLRYKDSAELVEIGTEKTPSGQTREYSDLHLESNLRTPRYGTYTSYSEMIDSVHEQDPFHGDYKPSGKTKKSKSKKHKREKDKSQEEDLSVKDPLSKSSRKQSKKGRKSEVTGSTGTYTIQGLTNKSFTDSGPVADTSSVKSNGTYTLKQEDSVDGFRLSKKSSVGFSRKRKTRRSTVKLGASRINQRSFRDFIMRNRIMIRVPLPVEEIETTLRREHAHLLRQTKHVWHYQTHTKPEPTDSFGYINFQGYGNEIEASPYLRCEPDTKPEIIWDMMINQWHLEPPQLIISVTGGAQRFDLKRRMQETFKRGLMNAATSTCAWIITGGTRTGVMEFVGDAVKDHIITTGRKNDVVVLGIATWGCVANRHALDGEEGLKNGLFPAVYSKADVMEARLLNPKNVPLDENHSHFLLIDDGSENKFGAEIDFRTKLEKYISEQQVDPDDKESSLTIPVISIIVEGGINSMKTVWQAVTRGIPVLVLQSSGRAADYIAHGYNITAHKLSEEKSYFPKDFDEEMENLANRVFEWKEKDTPRKPALIANCLKQLREALQHREMLTVFDLNDYETKDFDRAILYALLKANRSNTNAQLSLALAWNRSDIAKNEIFTASNKTNYQELKLDDAMMTALIQDRLEFVKLFLENGIDLSHFLDIRNLWNLYSNCFNDKTDGAAQLLMNRINYLRQTWAAYLCCKQTEDIGVEPDLLNYIGKVIVHLLGDEAMNLYAGNQYDVHSEEVVFGYIPKAEKPCEEYLSVKKNLSKKKSRLFPEVEFKNPAKDLFIWAVLMNRMSLAKLFWKIGKDHIGSALFASCLLKELAKVADDEEEVELSVSLEQNSMEFEKLASEILGICSIQNRDLAHQLLVRELNEFGNTTLFCLADENVLMDFMGQTCCQTKLNAIWKGRMALYTSSIKIVASICLPFLIPAIKFVDKKRMVHEDEYDDLAPLHPTTQEMITEQDAPPSNREGPEGITGAGGKVAPVPESKTKILKRKFKTVTLFGGSKEGGEDINLFRAIYYFYTAPVTKFTTAMFANILFLGLFSLFVLTDLYPIGENDAPSIPEYLTWMYTVTSVIEELRQILTRDQRSLLYKIRSWYGSVWNRFDFIMYLTFLTSVILRFSLSGEDFMWARMLYSLTLAMYFIRFMHYFYAEKNIGPKVIMISRMLTDLMFFLLILLVFILSFGVAYHANLYPNSPKEWVLLKDVVYHPYWQMYGELFLENKEGNDPSADAGTCTSNETIWRSGEVDRCPEKNALVVLLMVVYMLLTNILLVNLLIAMFSDTFQKVQDNSEKVWRYHRYSLVYEFYERPALFPPLIILNHLFRAIRWLINRCSSRCCKNEIRTRNSFKLKLSEKDLIRLSLFERGAMEEHQHSVFSLENDKIDKKIETTSERLDRVIEELDNIKDNVMAKEKMMGGEVPITARSTSMSNVEPEVYSARKTHSQLEVEVDQLSNFVRENMHDLNASIRRLEKLILASTKQKQQTLDISHFQTSES